MRSRLVAITILVIAFFLALFVYPNPYNKTADFINNKFGLKGNVMIPHFFNVPKFSLGLDLIGGAHLVYQGNLATIGDQNPKDAMSALRNDIEDRVNAFGVGEAVVQIEGTDRLVVELPGIKNLDEALKVIGATPLLEFREPLSQTELDVLTKKLPKGQELAFEQAFKNTGLTGKNLKIARVEFDQTTYQPEVSLELDAQGAKLFADITKRDLGKQVAIFLDNRIISAPTVKTEITNGKAVISGGFTAQQAKALAEYLNRGALPVPITLISQQSIGATLGADSLQKSLRAGLYGLLFVAIFMMIFYRLPGVVAVLALFIYTVVILAIYKIVPVTLSIAGIAGFILSLGMAVDANILIFARMREELKAGLPINQAVNEGFRRAWYSIRDGHVTTLLGAVILYMFTTSLVKGFALTLGIGVLMSLVTAVVISRSLLNLILTNKLKDKHWLY
ncbi:MAG: preprotein translocase subunit SecD [Parcubacteria group bacterium Licking1014_17]|nr:MAG: preprotein translocase subunit SecD [Parcubacteria group bacterium Licking1014_17]